MPNPTTFRIQIKIADQAYTALRVQGIEKISEPFDFTIEIIASDDLVLLPLQAAQLILAPTRKIAGIITAVSTCQLDESNRQIVTLKFNPQLAILQYGSAVRVFLNQSPLEVVKQILLANGYNETQLKFSLAEQYPAKPYILQPPGETNLEFMQRLLAKAGIFYWSETDAEDNQEILHFADNSIYCPYLENIIDYIPPSGLVPEAKNSTEIQRGFSHLELQYNSMVSQIEIIDHNEMQPSAEINATKGNGSSSHYTYYGQNTLDQQEAKKLAELYYQIQQTKAVQVNGKSDVPELLPGFSIKLAADKFSKLLSGDYLVAELVHSASQNIEQFGEEIPYQNKVMLVPRHINYKINYKKDIPVQPNIPSLFHAKIVGKQNKATLDKEGRYQVQPEFNNTNVIQHIPRLQPYGGNSNADAAVGFHTPLLNNAEVLLGSINGDPDRLVIFATVPNPEQQSPVTAKNPSQHRLVSNAGHELLLDDEKGQEKIRLSNANLSNMLLLDATQDNHMLTLATQHGEMHWQSQQQMFLHSEGSSLENIGNNKEQLIKKNYQLQTIDNDIHQQSAAEQNWFAKENILQQSQQDLTVYAAGDLNWMTQQQLKITSLSQDMQININQGNAILQSAKAIHIFADGQGVIEFCQANAGFQLTPDGVVNLFGNDINVISANPVKFKGKVNYLDDAGPTITPQTCPEPIAVQQIEPLKT